MAARELPQDPQHLARIGVALILGGGALLVAGYAAGGPVIVVGLSALVQAGSAS